MCADKIKYAFVFPVILLFTLSFHASFSQDDKLNEDKLSNKASNYFFDGNYKLALPLYQQLYKINPKDAFYNFCLGVSYFFVAPNITEDINKAKAIPLLEFAKEQLPIMDVSYYLAMAYHLNYQFEKAIKEYKNYQEALGKEEPYYLMPLLKKKEEFAFIERQIEMCHNGIAMVNDTMKEIKFFNMGEAINSAYADYAPSVSADNEVLVFTSRKPTSTDAKMIYDFMYYENIYISYKLEGKWTQAAPISENINTAKHHDASIGMSADAQILFMYYKGDIYMSQLEGRNWMKPKKLSKEINTSAWETHISITSAQNSVYFVSDRKGGYGGRDIYSARKLFNGEWGEVKNLGPTINTPYDEESPFIHPDERHLYFSSTGHNSMGGFDIFYSTLDDGKWTTPTNMGHPINTPDDDAFFSVSANGKFGYIATTRREGYGDKDIYIASMPDTGEVPLTVIRGLIRGEDAKPIWAKFTVTDNETRELVGIYQANSATGKYLLVFPPGKNYNIVVSADGYVPQSNKVSIPEQKRFYDMYQEVQLSPVVRQDTLAGKDILAGQKVFIRNAFFDIDSVVKIVDTSLAMVEVKEVAYSAFLSDLEHGENRDIILAKLQNFDESMKSVTSYKPVEEIHILENVDSGNLELFIAGYDTMYVVSSRTKTKIEREEIDTTLFALAPTHYVTKEEIDTAIFRPELYLPLTSIEKVVEEVVIAAEKETSTTAKADTAEYITMEELHEKLEEKKMEEIGLITKDTLVEKADEEARLKAAAEAKKKADEEARLKAAAAEKTSEKAVGSESLIGKSVVIQHILFEFNDYTLGLSSFPALDKLAAILKRYEQLVVEISGHTDFIGDEQYNSALSGRRARSVVNYIAEKGIKTSRLHAKGYGEDRPVADNGTPDGRKLNRRTELKVIGITGEIDTTALFALAKSEEKPFSHPDKVKTTSASTGTTGKASAISFDRAVVCRGVKNLTPVDEGTVFSADVGQLWLFSQFTLPAGQSATITHVWSYEGKQMAKITLKIHGPRWRNYSSKNIFPAWKGGWQVEIRSSDGSIIQQVPFRVE